MAVCLYMHEYCISTLLIMSEAFYSQLVTGNKCIFSSACTKCWQRIFGLEICEMWAFLRIREPINGNQCRILTKVRRGFPGCMSGDMISEKNLMKYTPSHPQTHTHIKKTTSMFKFKHQQQPRFLYKTFCSTLCSDPDKISKRFSIAFIN